ncbi:hypothetical protein, partial [Bacillus thuringiensis]
WDLVPVRVGRRQATVRRVRMTRLFCVYFYIRNAIIDKFSNIKEEKRLKMRLFKGSMLYIKAYRIRI